MSDIQIRPVATATDLKVFIRLPNELYRDDPNYVAPLEFKLGNRLNPAKNPGLKDSPHQLWVAYRDDTPVGRISALVNQAHLDRHHDATGHFGFFECEDNPETVQALLEIAGDWLRAHGMKKIAGPFNFSVNEECGLLVEGFDSPPFVMMPHGKPYYPARLEEIGFEKAVDMYALKWLPVRQFIPERRMKFVNKALDKPNISIRTLNKGDFLGDIRKVVDIFDDAWSDNWGFIPFSEEHIRHMANDLKPIIQKHNVVLCYLDDEPVAFGLVLPNVNRATRNFGGKLFPTNWVKFLWQLKIKGVDQARMPLMGVRKKLQGKPVGAAFAYKIIDMVNSANIDKGVTHTELSWILEKNTAMLTMLTDMGATIYKTYRIYEKTL